MKMPHLKRNFPLVAVILLAIALMSLFNAIESTNRIIQTANTTEKLDFKVVEPPRNILFYDSLLPSSLVKSIDTRLPELSPVDSIQAEGKTKTLPSDTLSKPDGKFYNNIRIGDRTYTFNMSKSYNEKGITKNRTLAVVLTQMPEVIRDYSIVIISFTLGIALLGSYRRGYLIKRNITFIRISSCAIGATLLAPYVSKLFIHVIDFYGIALDINWGFLLRNLIVPALLILAAVIGLSHLVCQSMRSSMSMKEEIDATI